MQRVKHFLGIAVAAIALTFAVVAPGSAQERTDESRAHAMTQSEIVSRLQQSGLTRAQVRARLQQLGYDPTAADQYFDVMETGANLPVGAPRQEFLDALARIGVSAPFRPEALTTQPDTLPADSVAVPADTVQSAQQVFGRSLFTRATSQFQPLQYGPVDASYRLGPGDEVILILTGDVELAYNLTVAREGFIVIPEVGQVFVNNLTLGQLESMLYDRLGRVYSGVRRGGGATTHFQVTVGRLRTNQVFLIGEVTRPGAYQVSSLATVFNALYAAGGPSEQGSFRRVQVRRGGQTIREVDIYAYLMRGENTDDIRLEQGDVVFVPFAGPRVLVEGSIRRGGVFELKPGEGLRDVLAYAGGLQAAAFARRIQIDRILPAERRRPGVDRVLIDVDLATVADATTPLQDGDIVRVFSVQDERRHRVVLVGDVRRPGVYEWTPGTTLRQVVTRAEGLQESAYAARAHVLRLNPEDGSRRLIRLSLEDTAQIPDVQLADRDSIVVFSIEQLSNPRSVAIDGFVKNPGSYLLAEGMSLKDLILSAGGFTPGAYLLEAEIARKPNALSRTDTTARVYRVPLDAPMSDGAALAPATGATGVPRWQPEAAEVQLEPDDRVFIRKAPGYEPTRVVTITGEILSPGTYALRTRNERLLDLIGRAGQLTPQANLDGLQLMRRGTLVATDLRRAFKEPQGRYNLMLEAGDSINVPRFDPTVFVTGAVAFESRVLYAPGQSLDYYISQAGGYTPRADKKHVSVAYQDGARSTTHRILLFRQTPDVAPGSTVYVPTRPEGENGFDIDRFLTRTLSILGTVATVLVAARRL